MFSKLKLAQNGCSNRITLTNTVTRWQMCKIHDLKIYWFVLDLGVVIITHNLGFRKLITEIVG